ncbi:MAG TPA: IS1380 family transposase [Saprospiraceae bacterium]|nr:IS1380 family transposase [Saprospiraceae bacterium]
MIKVLNSGDNIQAFGGLNFVSDHFDKEGLDKLIETALGSRSIYATYSYSDVIKNMWMLNFCGGECAEDIQTHFKATLENTHNLNVCSADTILRVQKELSTSKVLKISKNGTLNEFNTNDNLNNLNINILVKIGVLVATKEYDLDFDNQFIPCEKYDSKKGYKMSKGYFPSVASIGRCTVYLENRNGNTNVKYEQHNTLLKTFQLLNSHNIKINRARMDCGSFTREVIKVVESNTKRFYIRAMRCDDLSTKIKEHKEWKTELINDKKVEVASIYYKPFKEDTEYRYVVSREPNPTGQIDVFSGDSYTYRAIITNDTEMTDKEVIIFYNQRGGSEKIFDELNNDFGWAKIPFSFLNENTVYMMLMAMCRNFYISMIEKMSNKIPFIQTSFRLKKFILRFVVVPFKWIKQGGQKRLKLFTDKPYYLLN